MRRSRQVEEREERSAPQRQPAPPAANAAKAAAAAAIRWRWLREVRGLPFETDRRAGKAVTAALPELPANLSSTAGRDCSLSGRKASG